MTISRGASHSVFPLDGRLIFCWRPRFFSSLRTLCWKNHFLIFYSSKPTSVAQKMPCFGGLWVCVCGHLLTEVGDCLEARKRHRVWHPLEVYTMSLERQRTHSTQHCVDWKNIQAEKGVFPTASHCHWTPTPTCFVCEDVHDSFSVFRRTHCKRLNPPRPSALVPRTTLQTGRLGRSADFEDF